MQEVFEIWKDVSGYEGFYQASNKGNVRSVDRYIECRGTMKNTKIGRNYTYGMTRIVNIVLAVGNAEVMRGNAKIVVA